MRAAIYSEDEIVMISAIEHYSYCPRQCALIHVEQVFDENLFTLRGRQAHERVDTSGYEQEGGVRVERALPLWCDRLGLIGKADDVEFHSDGTIYPVEHKQRKRRDSIHDALQLCAQAACLEEMFGRPVEKGAIYHLGSHRRREVTFDDELRERMEETVIRVREDLRRGMTPPPVNDARCPNCSLIDACVPAVIAEARMEWHLRDLFRLEEPFPPE